MIILPAIDPIAFTLPFINAPIRWYALAYIAGFLVGHWYFKRLCRLFPAANLGEKAQENLFLWIILGVILGGRIGFVAFYNLPYYVQNPADILKTWEGGMSFHGGLVGVIVAIVLFCLKHKIHMADIADRVAPSVCFGIFFGRMANFVNGELWGRTTNVPWAMVFPHDPSGLPRHPSQLYEALLEGALLFAVLFLLTRKGWQRWQPAGVFLMGYGASRFMVEYVRQPDVYAYLGNFGFTTGQLLSIPMVLVGVTFVALSRR